MDWSVGDPPSPTDLFSTPLWLGISVNVDPEMTPRRPIAASAFAFKAADAATPEGKTADQLVAYAQSGGIPPGARIPIVELDLIMSSYGPSGFTAAIDLSLAGTPLPGGEFCRLSRIDGLSPAVFDDGGTPASAVRADRVTCVCQGNIAPWRRAAAALPRRSSWSSVSRNSGAAAWSGETREHTPPICPTIRLLLPI